MSSSVPDARAPSPHKNGDNRFLLLVAGLGGLLYGVDAGIFAGALPHLEVTSGLNAGQLSFIVAAVLLGSVISTAIAAIFLPTVGKYGYSTIFFAFAGCTAIYFITATFLLPETKGKTLEEIEAHFSRGKKKAEAPPRSMITLQADRSGNLAPPDHSRSPLKCAPFDSVFLASPFTASPC
jgi:MFS family permease